MSQTAIIGEVANGSTTHDFKVGKMLLKQAGYPLNETIQFVENFLAKINTDVFKALDEKTLLIKVPSGSGNNMVTHFFAEILSHKYKAHIMRNDLIEKTYHVEAKNNLTLAKRNQDPIAYKIDASTIRIQTSSFNRVIVIDDLIGSGESSLKLVKTLRQARIKVDAVLNLVTVEKRRPTLNDFDRVVKKLDAHLALSSQQYGTLKNNIEVVFADYTRQKLNRLERVVNSKKNAQVAFDAISTAAVMEKQFAKNIKNNLSL